MPDATDRTVSREDPGALAARSARGDREAFRALVEAHREFAWRIAVGLLHDRDEAEDAVQQAFIHVWENLDRFSEGGKFGTWLYRIVVNEAYDRIRRRSRRDRFLGTIEGWFGGGEPPGGDDPSAPIEGADIRQAVVQAAKRLPPRQSLVFHLRDLLDLSVEETAAAAGMSVNAVKVNLCHARKKVRKGLEGLRETME